MVNVTPALLKLHVLEAIETMKNGQPYLANGHGEWAVSGHRETGRIVIDCVDNKVLSDVAADLRAVGFAVDGKATTGSENTIVITLSTDQ